MTITELQQLIRQTKEDGWLFYDVHHRDEIAYRILGLDMQKLATRRWYYFLPREGEPKKLVHRVEQRRLEQLSGETIEYVGWSDMHCKLREILINSNRIFMQYSPYCNVPSVATVDAGTVELVRSFGKEIVSSADLVQACEATIDDEGVALHLSAANKVHEVRKLAFEFVFNQMRQGRAVSEYDVQQLIMREFELRHLTCDGLQPMVAVNEHAADPHFELDSENSRRIRCGDRILIDLWAREACPKGIYYDVTWCGVVGPKGARKYEELFDIVVRARQMTKEFIVSRMKAGKPVYGWEADEVSRQYISKQGYGDFVLHRTGHSIHHKVHGNGVNLDNLETRDEREIIAGTCFSIEPGIYSEGIGVRSEIDMLICADGKIIVAGDEQESLVVME